MFSLPWFEAVALAQANNPPSVSQLAQYRADTGVVIPFGTAVPPGVDVVFGGTVADADGDTVRLEVELQQLPGTFTGIATQVSDLVTSGSVAQTAAATGLAPGNYGWRARAVDSGGAASDWVLEANPNFKVSQGLPDLVFDAASANPQVVFKVFTSTSCEVGEGCAQPGLRTLLRFTAKTQNIGSADLVMGDPAGNPLFYFDTCHNHYHFSGFAEYRLLDASGQVAAGRKNGFCIEDVSQVDPAAPLTKAYTCRYQGIQAGWADVYDPSVPCQWIDITGVPAGSYTLELEVDPEHLLPESDYTNNVASVPVQLSEANVSTPTPTSTRTSRPTATPKPTRTITPTRTPTNTPRVSTPTITRSPTRTATQTAFCGGTQGTCTPTSSRTPTPTRTRTQIGFCGGTQATCTPTRSRTPTPTRTPTA